MVLFELKYDKAASQLPVIAEVTGSLPVLKGTIFFEIFEC